MQITQESKSQLAKLMATENLTVEYKKVPTAYFNLKERKLVVPILKEGLTPELYDLFVGHEISHALNTPEHGWHDSVIDLKIPKAILNVVEDARIEKLIKRKYPGLRAPFSKAYRELLSRDFFATNGVDLNGMNILDRLNLHFKIGASLGIKFDNEELFLVEEMEKLETFDDVIEVSKKIMALYRQEKEKRKQKNGDEPAEPTDEWSDDTDYSSEDFDDGDEVDEENDSLSDTPESPDDQSEDEDSADGKNSDGDEFNNTDDEIESYTDDAFRKREKELVSADPTDYEYGDIPEDIDLNRVIVPYKHIISRYKNEQYFNTITTNEEFNVFKKKSSKVVSYLVKEFELRKNADQMKRASIAKTGDLNMSKIYSYKFNDDIFKRLTIVPGGKSHGLVMFLDWSGSMVPHLNATIKQLLNLVLFCKKVNIPFEVYAFSNRFYYQGDHPERGKETVTYKQNEIVMKRFHLMNLLSNKMTANELSFMGSMLLHGSQHITHSRMRGFPDWMNMQYTPLNETIFSAMKIVPKFQKENKLQVVNTVFLTDGEGHLLCSRQDEDDYSFSTTAKRVAIIRHKSSGISEKVKEPGNESYTAAALSILKQVTNTNVIGFYLVNSREFKQESRRLFPKTANLDDIRDKFMKEKSVTCTSSGYDEYYIIRAETDVDDDGDFQVKSNTTRSLVTAFTKYNTNKVINRVVLNKFIGMIT